MILANLPFISYFRIIKVLHIGKKYIYQKNMGAAHCVNNNSEKKKFLLKET